ncbi:MAG: sirohydrochlorin chelatase, partial [Chloroflexota bacterium]
AMLPARYRQGSLVSATPMGAASMQYTEDGAVAWDAMWTQFCDLALAGGPKHRDTLLEPATADELNAAPDRQNTVLAELERGLRLVTGLGTVRSAVPGWVGLQCDDEAMARWLLCAVAVENISVRREDSILFLPSAPSYRLDKEIKSVVTVVAKTHHYWLEHRAD